MDMGSHDLMWSYQWHKNKNTWLIMITRPTPLHENPWDKADTLSNSINLSSSAHNFTLSPCMAFMEIVILSQNAICCKKCPCSVQNTEDALYMCDHIPPVVQARCTSAAIQVNIYRHNGHYNHMILSGHRTHVKATVWTEDKDLQTTQFWWLVGPPAHCTHNEWCWSNTHCH